MQLERENVSNLAADAVRAMIVEGRLADGDRINEVHLAEALGVSRTPLREGLGRLAAEGAVASRPKQGYFVTPLTLSEFEQLYDIRPILDPEALKLSGLPPRERIERLKTLNKKFKTARNAKAAVEFDNQWHLLLLAECPNRVLIELIEGIITRTRRYELALFRETKNVFRANDDHDRIIGALEARDLKAACAALKHNMQSGKAPMIEWLSNRHSKGEIR